MNKQKHNQRTSVFWPGILASAVGLFLGHPNPFWHVPPAVLLLPAFAMWLIAIRNTPAKKTFLNLFLAGILGYSASLHWIIVPVTEVGELSLFLAIPCSLVLGGYTALFPALSGFFICIFLPLFAQKNWSLPRLFLFAVAGSLVYAGWETLCGILFTGFPWLPLATAFAFQPAWVQAASILGNAGLTAYFVFCTFMIALMPIIGSTKRYTCLAIGGIGLLLLPVYGSMRLEGSDNISMAPFLVGMVQGNIDQNKKWEPEYQTATLSHYITLSNQLIKKQQEQYPKQHLSLILWPETAMPFYYSSSPAYSQILRTFAEQNKLYLGFGTLGHDRGTKGQFLLYNRFQTINPNGTTGSYYDKEHLVPFGEYIPPYFEFEFLVNIMQGLYFAPGITNAPIPMEMAPLTTRNNALPEKLTVPFGILICYEAIFPKHAQQRIASGAHVLINISNDAWFGRYSAPEQHLALTAMRAVEQQRPIIRTTNTGITTLIDSFGRVQQRSNLFENETMLQTVHPENTITLYHRMAFFIHTVLCVSVLLALGYALFYRVRNLRTARN